MGLVTLIRPSQTRSVPLSRRREEQNKKKRRASGTLTAKARSGAAKSLRLARREAPACRKARAIGLRFSARHPLIGEEGRRPVSKDRGARQSNPDA